MANISMRHKDNFLTGPVQKSHIFAMRRDLPPLNALRAFEAAGRHQSFSRAAEELGVSHSSISRHVRGLEDRLGVQLFRDLPRGLALSTDGAAYLADVTPSFDAIAAATEALAQAPEGTITVNGATLFTHKWLIPQLTQFQIDHPYAAPSLIPSPLQHPRDLLSYRLFRDRHAFTWSKWFAQAGGVLPQEVPETMWRLRSDLALEATIAGQGIYLVSAEIAEGEVNAGRLLRVFDHGFRDGSYFLVTRASALRRKPVRLFRDWLLARGAKWRGEGAG